MTHPITPQLWFDRNAEGIALPKGWENHHEDVQMVVRAVQHACGLVDRPYEGGKYRMDDGHIVVDSIERISRKDITHDLAREGGFASVDDLLKIAKHGPGDKIFLVRFHYLPPGAWDTKK